MKYQLLLLVPILVVAQTEGFAKPQTEGFAKPQTEGFAMPQTEGFAKPQTEGFAKPQTEGFFKPQTEGFFKPQTEGFFKPQTEGFFKPQTEGFTKPQTSEDIIIPQLQLYSIPISVNDPDKLFRNALQYAKKDFEQACQQLKGYKFEQLLPSYKRESAGINYYIVAEFSKGAQKVWASIFVWQFPFHSNQGKYYYRVTNCIVLDDIDTKENQKINQS